MFCSSPWTKCNIVNRVGLTFVEDPLVTAWEVGIHEIIVHEISIKNVLTVRFTSTFVPIPIKTSSLGEVARDNLDLVKIYESFPNEIVNGDEWFWSGANILKNRDGKININCFFSSQNLIHHEYALQENDSNFGNAATGCSIIIPQLVNHHILFKAF